MVAKYSFYARSCQGGKRPGGETGANRQSALGPMCDADKDWHERSFRASGAIHSCKKSPFDWPANADVSISLKYVCVRRLPFDKPEMKFCLYF